jgi:Ca-activated chloride channel family protein
VRKLILTLGVVALVAGSAQAVTLRDRMHSKIQQGNSHYEAGEHEEALESYLDAERVDSTQAVPQFNAGDALYRLGRFPEGARKFLNSSASPTDSMAAMSYYNLGNSMFKGGDFERAAEAYKRSLLIDPDDEDAKYNLELAARMMEEQQQQKEQQEKQQQDKGQQNKEQGENKQNDETAKQKGQDTEEEQKDKEQGKSQQGEQERDEQREQGQPQPDQGEISPEDLDRILAAIEASDKDTQEEMLKKAAKRKRVTGKDW